MPKNEYNNKCGRQEVTTAPNLENFTNGAHGDSKGQKWQLCGYLPCHEVHQQNACCQVIKLYRVTDCAG